MAEKDLKIRLSVDTSQVNKLSAVLSSQEKSGNAFIRLENERLALLDKQDAAFKKYAVSVAGLQQKLKEQPGKEKFFLGAAKAAATSLKNELDRVAASLDSIAEKERNVAFKRSFAIGGFESRRQYEQYSAESAELKAGSAAEKQAKDFALVEAAMKAHKDRMLKEQRELEAEFTENLRRRSEERKSTLKNEFDFAEAARKRELDALKRDILQRDALQKARNEGFGKTVAQYGIYKPKSDYGIALTAGMSAAGRQAEEMKNAEKQSKALATGIDNLEKTHRSLIRSVIESTVYYKTFTFVVGKVQEGLLSIPQIGIQFESSLASLTASFKTIAGANRELEFLREEADRTGLSLTQLRESYQKAAASFIAAGESAATTREIFSNINTVSTTLHLNAQETGSIYLALSQIFNKTKLQAEELTKQLSQVIPGVTNEQAKALGISVSELYDKMKKGAITANEAVLALSETLAQTYGGTAFERATKGLNAELGRLRTSWQTLAETVYKATSEMMVSVVKFATQLINSFNDSIGSSFELRNAIKTLAVGVAGSAAAYIAARTALLAYDAIVVLTAKNTDALTKAQISLANTLKRNIFTSAIFAAGAYVAKLQEIKLLSMDVDSYIARIKEQPTPGVDSKPYTIDQDFRVREAKAALEAAQKIEKDAGERTVESKKKIDFLLKNLQNQRSIVAAELAKTEAETSGNIVKKATDVTDELNKVQELYLEATGEGLEAARQRFLNQNKKLIETLMQSYAEGNLEAAEGLKKLQETYDKIKERGAEKKESLVIKQINDEIQVNKQAQEKLQADNENALAQNIISYQKFFERKLELYQNDYEARKFLLQKGLEESEGLDEGKASDFRGKLQELEYEQEKRLSDLQAARYQANKNNFAEINQIAQEYYSLVGNTEESLKADQLSRYGEIEKSLLNQIALGIKDAQVGYDRIQTIKQLQQANAEYAKQKELITIGENKYQDAINKVNILRNIGAISEISAAKQITALNRTYQGVLEKNVQVEEERLETLENTAGVAYNAYMAQVEAVRKAREELENLKLTGDTVAQFFEKQLGDAFESAFVSFSTGASTAGEAFTKFAEGVVAGIAKMVAEEARSAIFTGLLKPAFSGLSGGIGSFFSGLFADGGVATGLNAGNGKVLTAPTYFPKAKVIPFASGGVVAGEAGAEAALPLKRLRNGKLGVQTEGGTGGNIINISVSIDRSTGESDSSYANKVAETIARRIAKEEIANAARPGNINNRVTKFG